MILLYNLNLLFRFIADLAQLDVEQIQASGLQFLPSVLVTYLSL